MLLRYLSLYICISVHNKYIHMCIYIYVYMCVYIYRERDRERVVQSLVVSNSLWPYHGLQHAKLPCPSLSPRVGSNSCPLSRWCHPPISPSVVLFSSCPQSIFLSSLHYMVKVLELQPQHQSFQWVFRIGFLKDWLVWSPWCPRDSQEFSPTP